MLMVLLNINSNIDAGKERGKVNNSKKKGLFDSLFLDVLEGNKGAKKQLSSEKPVNSFPINFWKRTKIETDSAAIKSLEREKFVKEKEDSNKSQEFIVRNKFEKKNLKKIAVLSDRSVGFFESKFLLKENVASNFKSEKKKKQRVDDLLSKDFDRKSVASDFREIFFVKTGNVLEETALKEKNLAPLSQVANKKDEINLIQVKKETSLLKNRRLLDEFYQKLEESLKEKENLSAWERLLFSNFYKDKIKVKRFENFYLSLKKDEKVSREREEFGRVKLLKEDIDGNFGQFREERQISAAYKFFTESFPVDFNEKVKGSSIDLDNRKSIGGLFGKAQMEEVKDRGFKRIVKHQGKGSMVSFMDVTDIDISDKKIKSAVKPNMENMNEQIKLSKQEGDKLKVSVETKNLTEVFLAAKKGDIKVALGDKNKGIKPKESVTKGFQAEESEEFSVIKSNLKSLGTTERSFQAERLDGYFQGESSSFSGKEIEKSLNGEIRKVQLPKKRMESKVKNAEKTILNDSKKEEKRVYPKKVYKRKILEIGLGTENRNFRLVKHKFESFITNRLTDRHFDTDRHNMAHESRFTDTSFQSHSYHNAASFGSSNSYSGDSGNGYSNHNSSLAGNSSTNIPSEKFVLSARFEDLRLKARMVKRFVNVTIEIPQVTFSFTDLKDEIREILRNSNLAGLKVKVKSKGKEIYSEAVFSDEVKSTSSLELRV